MDYVGQTAAVGDAPWWSAGSYYNRGQFADVSSNAVRTMCVGDQVVAQNGFNRDLMHTIQSHTDDLIMTGATDAKLLGLAERINGVQRDAAACCCDLKQQIAESKAEMINLIKDNTIASLSADLHQCRINESNQAQTNAILAAIAANNS